MLEEEVEVSSERWWERQCSGVLRGKKYRRALTLLVDVVQVIEVTFVVMHDLLTIFGVAITPTKHRSMIFITPSKLPLPGPDPYGDDGKNMASMVNVVGAE